LNESFRFEFPIVIQVYHPANRAIGFTPLRVSGVLPLFRFIRRCHESIFSHHAMITRIDECEYSDDKQIVVLCKFAVCIGSEVVTDLYTETIVYYLVNYW